MHVGCEPFAPLECKGSRAALRAAFSSNLGAMAEGLETQIKALIAFLQVSAAEPHLVQAHIRAIRDKITALPRMSLEQATTLGSALKGAIPLISADDMKEIWDALHSKVQEAPLDPRAKRPLQEWLNWALFLTEELRRDILTLPNTSVVLKKVVQHLHKLGLRCPSETVMGTLTAMLVLRTEQGKGQVQTASQWFDLHKTVKSQVKAVLELSKASDDTVIGPYLRSLPDAFERLDPALQTHVFGDERPAEPKTLVLCIVIT